MSRSFVEPGEARVADIKLDPHMLNRSARSAKWLVRLHTEQKWNMFVFASHDYSGRYISEDSQTVPAHHEPLITELDTLMPPELQEISVLRDRFRGSRDAELMHYDGVNDYRTITVYSGSGVLRLKHGDGLIEGSQTLPLYPGVVVEMNNMVDNNKDKLWHRAEGNLLLMVYGKYARRELTWHS